MRLLPVSGTRARRIVSRAVRPFGVGIAAATFAAAALWIVAAAASPGLARALLPAVSAAIVTPLAIVVVWRMQRK